MSEQHLVCQDTECPPIDSSSVSLFKQDLVKSAWLSDFVLCPEPRTHLWSHELWSTTESTGSLAIPHLLLTKTVISNLDVSIEGQKDVIELEISVDDTLRMEVLEGEQYLACVEFGLTKCELLLLNVKHEITTRNVLHDKVDSSLGLETRVKTEQERVSLLSCRLEYPLLRLRTRLRSALCRYALESIY